MLCLRIKSEIKLLDQEISSINKQNYYLKILLKIIMEKK